MVQPPALLPTQFRSLDDGDDQLVIEFMPTRNPSLKDLADSFAALDRFHERAASGASELVLTRIESGSIIATIAAMSPFLGHATPVISHVNNALTFGKRLAKAVRAFADLDNPTGLPAEVSYEDANDLELILRPVAKNGGGKLGLRSINYASQSGEITRRLDIQFNDNEVARAYDASSRLAPYAMQLPEIASEPGSITQKLVLEEALILDQTTRKPAKEAGRTGDRGVIASVSDKVLPVYFRKNAQGLKDKMILSDDNPLKFVFIVDAFVHYLDGNPTAYTAIALHSVMPLGD